MEHLLHYYLMQIALGIITRQLFQVWAALRVLKQWTNEVIVGKVRATSTKLPKTTSQPLQHRLYIDSSTTSILSYLSSIWRNNLSFFKVQAFAKPLWKRSAAVIPTKGCVVWHWRRMSCWVIACVWYMWFAIFLSSQRVWARSENLGLHRQELVPSNFRDFEAMGWLSLRG
jgi:thiosulfate reductase cytochrome b subunit